MAETISVSSLICAACIDADMENNGKCVKPSDKLGFCGGREACEIGLEFVTRKMARTLLPSTLINVDSTDRGTIVGVTSIDSRPLFIFRQGRILSSQLEDLSPDELIKYRDDSLTMLKEL